jgi:hypothetical protein
MLIRVALGRDPVPIADRGIDTTVDSHICEIFGSRLIANADGKAPARSNLDIASAFQKSMAIYRNKASALIRPTRCRRPRDKAGTAKKR